jgi:hypothetical protein
MDAMPIDIEPIKPAAFPNADSACELLIVPFESPSLILCKSFAKPSAEMPTLANGLDLPIIPANPSSTEAVLWIAAKESMP